MTRVVAFMNPAGSTAKTTTLAALAHLAVLDGKRTLVIELDPQGNLSVWLGGQRDTAGISQAFRYASANDPRTAPGIPESEVIADRSRMVRRTVQRTELGVDVIAADVELEDTTRNWSSRWPGGQGETLLADVVAAVADDYDVILLDCKGDMGVLSVAALRAATAVVGVATPTSKALEGLQRLAAETSRDGLAPLAAVVPSRIEHRNRGAEADDLAITMRTTYADRITPDVRKNRHADSAYWSAEPITVSDPKSNTATDLRAVYADLQAKGVLP